jgi:hypothetical protein
LTIPQYAYIFGNYTAIAVLPPQTPGRQTILRGLFMKKHVSVLTAILGALLVLGSVLVSCKSDPDPNPFVGTFKGNGNAEGITVTMTETTWAMTMGNDSMSGTYTYSGNTATFTYTEGGETETSTATLSGDTLTVDTGEDMMGTITLTRQ